MTVKASALEVRHEPPTYAQRIENRWGNSLGDSATYHLSVKGTSFTLSVGAKTPLECSTEVAREIAQAILRCLATQAAELRS